MSIFLNAEEWGDADLRDFFSKIQTDDAFTVSGFKSHSFFFNYRAENLFSPDIIVFDWDTGDGIAPTENLLKLLKSTYCLIAVFTSADTEGEVTSELENFKEFEYRLSLIKKNEDDSVQQLKDIIEAKKSHFSFQYGNKLKLETERALSDVLSNIGRLSYEELISLFGVHIKSESKSKLYELDFIEIILDRIKAVLISSGYDKVIEVEHKNINDEQLIRKIWHFRLYQKPNDSFVRKGDIIKIKDSDLKYLVLSSDCHLDKFWQKNIGHIALIPIYQLGDERIINKIKQYNKNNIAQFSISSLINPRGLESITILPGVFFDNTEKKYVDGLLSPKEVLNVEIPLREGDEPKQHLKYKDETTIIGKERIRLVEPFLSPVVQFVLKTITNVGVPDFGEELQCDIKKKIQAYK